MKKPSQFTNVGNDLQGNPILDINGERYFYVDGERGESTVGPDYDYAELTTPAVN